MKANSSDLELELGLSLARKEKMITEIIFTSAISSGPPDGPPTATLPLMTHDQIPTLIPWENLRSIQLHSSCPRSVLVYDIFL